MKILQRGVAPLHLASRHGHAQVVRMLIDHGADPNLLSKAGLTPFHLAARYGHEAVVEILLDKGTRVLVWGGVAHMLFPLLCHLSLTGFVTDMGEISRGG